MFKREELRCALELLNGLLLPAIARAESEFCAKFGEPSCRGVVVHPEDAQRAVRLDEPNERYCEVEAWHQTIADDRLYRSLQKRFHLNAIDFGLLLLALAPEEHTAYERAFGFLHDDVTRRRASVELAGRLLAPSDRQNVAARLDPAAPLLALRLIELADPPEAPGVWLAKQIRIDEQFGRWVFGVATLDRRLAGIAEYARASHDLSRIPIGRSLRLALSRSAQQPQLRLHLHGPDAAFGLEVADALANESGKDLLIADVDQITAPEALASERVRLLIREAKWFKKLLVLTDADIAADPSRKKAWGQVSQRLGQKNLSFVILGSRPTLPFASTPLRAISLEIPLPDADERLSHWKDSLDDFDGIAEFADLELVADRYGLTRTQIELAASDAVSRARKRSLGQDVEKPIRVRFEDLSLASRSQGGHALESLTTKISPKIGLDQVVLPNDVHAQLREIADRIEFRDRVHRDWGFARRQSYGLGTNALFAGPPGTGKTLAAEALASQIHKDLYKIDLTSVVSKYIGETEQKLEQVFRAGEATQAVLFFDEADSLLGKRSEVKDAHDRYANLEVSYMLQRMERYDGLIILATNLPGNLDEAFLRRMSAIVHFPAPTATERRTLWRQVWPTDEDGKPMMVPAVGSRRAVDTDFLATRFELTGGNIRNAAVAAAFFAAGRRSDPEVTMWDVLQAIRREFQKLGQTMSDQELGLDQYDPPLIVDEPAYVQRRALQPIPHAGTASTPATASG